MASVACGYNYVIALGKTVSQTEINNSADKNPNSTKDVLNVKQKVMCVNT